MQELNTCPSEPNQNELAQEGFAFDHVALKKKLDQRNLDAQVLTALHEHMDSFSGRKHLLAKYLFQKLEFSFANEPRSLIESLHLLDKDYWHEFFEDVNLVHLVSGDQLDEMREQVANNNQMSFTEEVVMNLIGNIWENRNMVFSQKIQSVLNNLSSSYKSNTGHSVSAKIVIPASRGNNINWETCNALDDLRIAARQLCNLPVQLISSRTTIHYGKMVDDWIPVDSDIMRFKVFNNGNIHVWFSDDLLVRFNEVLNLVQANTLGQKAAKRKSLSYKIEMKTQLFTNQEVSAYSKLIEPLLRSGSFKLYDFDMGIAHKMVQSFDKDVLTAVPIKRDAIFLSDQVEFTLKPESRIYFMMEMFLGGYEKK